MAINVESSPADCVTPVVAVFTVPKRSPAKVVPVNIPPIVTLVGKVNLTFWAVTAVVIWRFVPSKSNVSLFKRTDDVPESPVKSKSCASSSVFTKAVVATLVVLSVAAWVVADAPSGSISSVPEPKAPSAKLIVKVWALLTVFISEVVPNKLNAWVTKFTVWFPPVVPTNVNTEGSTFAMT